MALEAADDAGDALQLVDVVVGGGMIFEADLDIHLEAAHAGDFELSDGHLFEQEAAVFVLPIGEVALADMVQGGGIFAGEQDGSGGEAVGEGIEADGGFTLGGAGSGGPLSVAPVGGDLSVRWHDCGGSARGRSGSPSTLRLAGGGRGKVGTRLGSC
jgi:hypothetical protein